MCVFWLTGEKGNTRGNREPLLGDPHRLKINHVQLCLKGSTELIQNDAGSLAPRVRAAGLGKTRGAAEITTRQLATGASRIH